LESRIKSGTEIARSSIRIEIKDGVRNQGEGSVYWSRTGIGIENEIEDKNRDRGSRSRMIRVKIEQRNKNQDQE
jgi:hypothetical protein